MDIRAIDARCAAGFPNPANAFGKGFPKAHYFYYAFLFAEFLFNLFECGGKGFDNLLDLGAFYDKRRHPAQGCAC